MDHYPDDVLEHLRFLYGEGRRRWACTAGTPAEAEAWRREARPALGRLLGLDRIAEDASGFTPHVELGAAEDLGECTRTRGVLAVEPHRRVDFWLLRPGGAGPFPLGVFPHGHEHWGMNTYAGVYADPDKRAAALAEDRDVAVQAARAGFVAVAPATRGFEPATVADLGERHGGSHCRSTLVHNLLAGRTAIGERVWDLMRVVDWACSHADVDSSQVLMMGNSGGGVATLYAAACDERVTAAVASCSFCTLVGQDGRVHHCDCNTVPGILTFGECWDVAGLIAPRRLLVVHGRQDPLFPASEVARAIDGVRRVYAAAGASDRFAHRVGDGGHRFYSDLMWPFVLDATTRPEARRNG